MIVRTYTYYVSWIHQTPNEPTVPGAKSWDEAGITEQCTKVWESLSWAISKAAAAYHVRVADVYTAFNGKTHLEDPVAKGYMQSGVVHPNNKGRAVIAKTLAALGYGQVKPPRLRPKIVSLTGLLPRRPRQRGLLYALRFSDDRDRRPTLTAGGYVWNIER